MGGGPVGGGPVGCPWSWPGICGPGGRSPPSPGQSDEEKSSNDKVVIPAQAGIHVSAKMPLFSVSRRVTMDPRLRGDDGLEGRCPYP
ncbi:hypothetical protein MTBUT4_150029 [Magnetospirillum sp. UT-4]|nr:hypothetical protein MTBUT4_150029 [Magnetospirillum sp. UT-4]